MGVTQLRLNVSACSEVLITSEENIYIKTSYGSYSLPVSAVHFP